MCLYGHGQFTANRKRTETQPEPSAAAHPAELLALLAGIRRVFFGEFPPRGYQFPPKKIEKKKQKAVVGAGGFIEVLRRGKCDEAGHWTRGGRDKLKRRRR